ncbi:hypothetical protein CTheo_7403 [Ceratobasidium theobromae]|uniref:Uncharacterized protein n=1 Tax=Ceratobasidium theobromae TaxID=1582974 RepID=A0A5N5QBK6_9AGAM|nr:hypothetical protein CTheo_7403 [Ceratobasidium theobromae]
MAPRAKPHRTLSATNRTHSTASLHKGERISSSSALAAKRTASKTSVQRASTTRLNPDKQLKTQPDDEGWVSSASEAGTPINPEDDDDDDELDDDEILLLRTQRAQRNAREAERLKAAMAAAEAELLAQQREEAQGNSSSAQESPKKHSNLPPASPSPRVASRHPQPTPPQLRQAYSPPVQHIRQTAPQATPPRAPVIQQPDLDHSKHSFSAHSSSPSPAQPSTRAEPHYAPVAHDFVHNGVHDSHPSTNDHLAPSRPNGDERQPSNSSSSTRPSVRRSHSHAPRQVPTLMASQHLHPPARTSTLGPSRPHPLIRPPTLLTKSTPSLPPLTAPPYLSAHSAQGTSLDQLSVGPAFTQHPGPSAQMSSSPPPQTPSSASSPPHTRQPSLSSSTHTLPTLQVSPTAALNTSVSSLPHSPQTRAASIHSSPTTSYKPAAFERERTVSAVSSTAALHALAHHHLPARKSTGRHAQVLQASTFPPEPADTYSTGVYGGGPGAGGYHLHGGMADNALGVQNAVVGASGGMYGGKPGPIHALLPAPYMATHLSIGRWYAPARDAIGRVVRGRPGA